MDFHELETHLNAFMQQPNMVRDICQGILEGNAIVEGTNIGNQNREGQFSLRFKNYLRKELQGANIIFDGHLRKKRPDIRIIRNNSSTIIEVGHYTLQQRPEKGLLIINKFYDTIFKKEYTEQHQYLIYVLTEIKGGPITEAPFTLIRNYYKRFDLESRRNIKLTNIESKTRSYFNIIEGFNYYAQEEVIINDITIKLHVFLLNHSGLNLEGNIKLSERLRIDKEKKLKKAIKPKLHT